MIDLLEYGFHPEELREEGPGLPARVTAVHRERYELICVHGPCFGRLKSKVYYRQGTELFPTVGDFVRIEYNKQGDSQIVRTLPRRTFFSRRDPFPSRPLEQAIAANFDTVLLVQSLNENFNAGRLERYLSQARQSGAEPVVVLTKADLPGDHGAMVEEARQTAAGAPVYPVSVVTGQGMEMLEPYLRPGRTLALLGSSGVGKSSLINFLAGRELMATGEVRQSDSRGRHTTTHRQMLRLPSGALVIDTPGMRELGLWNAEDGLGATFPDVEALLRQCRFSDCRHESEPGCAVQEAIRQGTLSRERWERFRKLQKEAEAVKRRPATRRK